MKRRKRNSNRSRVFEIALLGEREDMERWRAWKFCVEELQSFDAFVRLKAAFSKH